MKPTQKTPAPDTQPAHQLSTESTPDMMLGDAPERFDEADEDAQLAELVRDRLANPEPTIRVTLNDL